MTSSLRVRQKWNVIGRTGAGEVASVLDVQSLFTFIKENWICTMTRHHAESNINILLTGNLPRDSGVRQRSHPLMTPTHCLWTELNNRTRGQFECNVTWFCFGFHFVRSRARRGCCSIVCWSRWGREFASNRTSKVKGAGNFGRRWTRGPWSSKLDNVHERHICIISKSPMFL